MMTCSPFACKMRAELSSDVERKIFFVPITAHLSFVVPAMSRIQNDRLNPAHVRNAMGTHQRLDCFRHISARDQIFSVVLHHRKAQPTARAVDHCFPAAAHKFQRIFDSLETDFIARTSDAGGQSIKLRNILNGQIIVPAYFNDLPIAGSKCRCLRKGWHSPGT